MSARKSSIVMRAAGAKSMRVLIAVDGSSYGWKTIDYVASQRQLFDGARLTLVHVDVGYSDRVMRAARQRLRRTDLTCKEVVLAGNVGVEVAKYARKGRFDLVVMGSHGYSAIERLLLGSVASKVLALCKTPVLLVR